MSQPSPNRHVLVTGGAGYIGSHACKSLSRAGYVPVTYDNLVYGHRRAVRWGPMEVGDIADRVRLDEVFRTYEPLAVVHFAAYAYVGESVSDPLKYYRNNVAGTLTLLEAMRDHAVDRMVFSSTCATYGNPQEVPIPEDHPQAPINPYGASKQMVERMLADAGAAHGIRSVALRYFNAAGADPEGETGEDHDPETHLIPLVLDAAAGRRPRITVFGDDYDTPDGTCVRDYIHVTDLAQAHVLALQDLERCGTRDAGRDNSNKETGFPLGPRPQLATPKPPGDGGGLGPAFRAYNLGNGRGFSVREVIEAAEKVTGRAVPVEIGDRRAGDPPVLVGDSRRARAELGWSPDFADLEQIVGTAWEWHRKLRAR